MTADWFEAALEAEEADFPAAEQGLRAAIQAEPEQREVVSARLDDPDPMVRLLAQVVLSDADAEEPQVGQVDAYLERVRARYAGTPARVPPVPAVVEELTARFGTQLGELLALRLARSGESEPWREAVALAYLTRHPTPAATEALLRYATRTGQPALQTAAAQAVAASRDRDVGRKLAAETARLAAGGRTMPAAVTAVLT